MTFTELVDLVSQMRLAQKKYFASCDRTSLEQSKALERQVDIAIKQICEQDDSFKTSLNLLLSDK